MKRAQVYDVDEEEERDNDLVRANMRRFREAEQLSYTDVAFRMGGRMSGDNYRKYEVGERPCSKKFLRRLALSYGRKWTDFYQDDPPGPRKKVADFIIRRNPGRPVDEGHERHIVELVEQLRAKRIEVEYVRQEKHRRYHAKVGGGQKKKETTD